LYGQKAPRQDGRFEDAGQIDGTMLGSIGWLYGGERLEAAMKVIKDETL